MKQSVQITILGQQFHLKSDESADQVRRVADFVNGQIAQVTASGRATDSLQAAILALLNVSAVYLQHEGQTSKEPLPTERLDRLAEQIERALDHGGASV